MKQILSVLLFLVFSISYSMAQNNTCTTSKQGILSGENSEIFQKEYESYQVDTNTLQQLNLNGLSIKVVLGNWCEDSQREVPRLMKIIDLPLFKVPVSYFLVDRDKYCPDPDVQALQAQYVPAIIFYRNNLEIGRIVELPEGSLEKNIANIIGK